MELHVLQLNLSSTVYSSKDENSDFVNKCNKTYRKKGRCSICDELLPLANIIQTQSKHQQPLSTEENDEYY